MTESEKKALIEKALVLLAFYYGAKVHAKAMKYALFGYVGLYLLKYFKANGTLAGNPLGMNLGINTDAAIEKFFPQAGQTSRALMTRAADSLIERLHQ